jgi:hypothetical protein
LARYLLPDVRQAIALRAAAPVQTRCAFSSRSRTTTVAAPSETLHIHGGNSIGDRWAGCRSLLSPSSPCPRHKPSTSPAWSSFLQIPSATRLHQAIRDEKPCLPIPPTTRPIRPRFQGATECPFLACSDTPKPSSPRRPAVVWREHANHAVLTRSSVPETSPSASTVRLPVGNASTSCPARTVSRCQPCLHLLAEVRS